MVQQLHPILEQMSPSPEQRKPIISRGCDVVVTAGAGTGKTRTLVGRYLSLLVDGYPLRSVVAITFTKKAAREMRNRIREEVRKYIQGFDLGPSERNKWREIYDRLDAARISTIHTLCAEILRHHPAESGVDPDFEMIEEGKMALLQSQTVEEALGWAVDDSQTVALFSTFGARELGRILHRLLEKRLDVAQVIQAASDDPWRVWQELLIKPIQTFLDHPEVCDHFRKLMRLREDGTLKKAEQAGDALAPDLHHALTYWDQIQDAKEKGDWIRVSWYLAPLRDSLKQKGRQENWAPAHPKKSIKIIQEVYDERLYPLVKDGLDLSLDRRLAQEILPTLNRLFNRALTIYTKKKDQIRSLDFDDLEGKALALLRENGDVRAYWQEKVQALLVDEFQDTNHRQRDLLDLLNGDQGKLFIVGDGKQSIYRFRGADVAVFQNEKEQIRRQGEGYHLATSYRAHEGLIADLNSILEPVLGEAHPERPFIAPFEPLEPHRTQPRQGVDAPYVELHLAVGKKGEGALGQAARAIARRLVDFVEYQNDVRGDGSGRVSSCLDYEDVAILCRASNSFAAYENALENAGIPFTTISGRGFYERPEVRDVLNALRAMADPYDDLALAGLLRSPAAGLSDIALYRLREKQREHNQPTLYDLFEDGPLSFLEEEEEQAYQIRTWFDSLRQKVGRVTVAKLIKDYLDSTYFLASLLRAGQTRSVTNVKKLLADAHQSGLVSVSTFLAYVDELRDISVREGEAQAIASGAVQIMTVHQAKGLEFPIVVIGDLSRGAPNVRDVMLDEQLGVIPPLRGERELAVEGNETQVQDVGSIAYRMAREREKEEEDAESDRLLYVASTRAQDKLLLSGVLGGIKNDNTPYRLGGWLEKLGHPLGLQDRKIDYEEGGDRVHTFELGTDSQTIACFVYEPDTALEVESMRKPILPPGRFPENRSLLNPLPEKEEAEGFEEKEEERQVWRVVQDSVKSKAPSWLIGKLVHQALAEWFFPGQNEARFEAWATGEARSSGLTEVSLVEYAVKEAAELLTRFQKTDLYRAMDKAKRRYHEVPFSFETQGGQVEKGKIDALYIKNHRWALVEFKTDEVYSKKILDKLLEEEDYLKQVERYLTAAEKLLGQQPEPVLCFLNFKGDVHLVKGVW
ncbi:MAG: UvrD-helicase domain-containing protein [Anaerolineales bacterium]